MWKTIKHVTAVALGWMAIAVFLVLVVDVLWGVLTRNFIGEQARWSEELARFLLVWVSFLGGAIAYLDDKHLGVDILVGGFDGGGAAGVAGGDPRAGVPVRSVRDGDRRDQPGDRPLRSPARCCRRCRSTRRGSTWRCR